MVRLIFLMIMTVFFTVNAQEKKPSLPEVMLKMEQDTVKILKGFLRNKNEWIIQGAKDIKNHPKIVEQIYSYAKPERRTPAFKKYIVEFDNLVREEAKTIQKFIKEGNKGKASQHFAKMLDRCNGCHAVFRGW